MTMTWEEKLCALKALNCGMVDLGLHRPGDWYCVVQGARLQGNGFYQSCNGFGSTPEAATNAVWQKIVEWDDDTRYLKAGDRNVKWNGFMWEAVTNIESHESAG